MDKFTPLLLNAGVKAVIGKGRRSEDVKRSLVKNKAVYFLATGGAGALYSTRVLSCKAIYFKELGPEAIYRLYVERFPLVVGIDTKGKDVYQHVQKSKGLK